VCECVSGSRVWVVVWLCVCVWRGVCVEAWLLLASSVGPSGRGHQAAPMGRARGLSCARCVCAACGCVCGCVSGSRVWGGVWLCVCEWLCVYVEAWLLLASSVGPSGRGYQAAPMGRARGLSCARCVCAACGCVCGCVSVGRMWGGVWLCVCVARWCGEIEWGGGVAGGGSGVKRRDGAAG
jgi:hypothetical protein